MLKIKSGGKRGRKIMQVPVIRSMDELKSKLGEKAYQSLKKKIKEDRNKKG